MAQKMVSIRSGAKKASQKPADRKGARAASVAKAVKPRRKGAATKAQPKHAPRPEKPKTHVTAAAKVTKPQAAPAAQSAKPHTPVSKTTAAIKQAVIKQAAVRQAAVKQAVLAAARPAVPPPVRTMPAAVTKTASQRIIAPPSAPSTAAKVAMPPKKPVHQRHGFKIGEWVVYPAHGVGRIIAIEEQEIAQVALELFVITFEKDKMTLRVPTGKSQSVGMRKLADEATAKRAMETLKGRARVKRTMWSRRAQEYEAKINSGDLIAIAEVVRDLYRSESQPEQSYSERQLYEAALDRMAREIAVVDKLDERGAVQRITEVLAKSARGRRAAEEAETKAA